MTVNTFRVMLRTLAIPFLVAYMSRDAWPDEDAVPVSEPAVLFVSQDRTDGQAQSDAAFASGFVVKHREDLFLVTAKHCAEEFNHSTTVGIAGPLRSIWANLAEITRFTGAGDQTRGRKNQVSVFKIIADHVPKPFLSEAQHIAVGSDELMTEIPHRGTKLAVVGYPVVIQRGAAAQTRQFPALRFADDLQAIDDSLLLTDDGTGAVTGIEVTTFVATRELQLPDDEELNMAVFVSPSVHPQLSGSPVFVRRGIGRNRYAGMFVGCRMDELEESWISAFVAARHIRDEILRAVEEN